MDKRHGMTMTELVVLLEPRSYFPAFRLCIKSFCLRQLDELRRRDTGFRFDVIQVGLKRHSSALHLSNQRLTWTPIALRIVPSNRPLDAYLPDSHICIHIVHLCVAV